MRAMRLVMLGALVRGSRLRELSPHIERVIIHTDDVPGNYLEAFEKVGLWQLRKVDYIDGVSDLYVSKGNICRWCVHKVSGVEIGGLCESTLVGH